MDRLGGTTRLSPHHHHLLSKHLSNTYWVPGSVLRVLEMNKPGVPFCTLFLGWQPAGGRPKPGSSHIALSPWGRRACLGPEFLPRPQAQLPTSRVPRATREPRGWVSVDAKLPQPQQLQEEGGCPEADHEGALCSAQHAGSVGTLLDFGQPRCARGLQSEAEGAAQEEQEEVMEEEEEEEQAFQVSLKDLAGHKGSEKGARPEPSGSEEEEEEESLAVAEQVADFASSLLAALHCWHYRANALLFSRGAMVRCLFDLPSSLHASWHVLAHP